MSATGVDTKNLNKEGETPAAALSEDIPNNTPTDVSSCVLKDVVQTPLTSQGDYLEDPREVEYIIEKKLPSDKEKALDVDSELDFELKWDDDSDLNENRGENDDIELDSTDKETVSLKEKDIDSLDKQIDSAFASTEKELDSLNKKTDSNCTSIDKDLDSLDKEIDSALTPTEKNLDDPDHEIETNLMSIEKDESIDTEKDSAFTFADKNASNLDKEIRSNLISIEKNLDSVDKKPNSVTPADNLDKGVEDAAPGNGLGIVSKDIQDGITSLVKDNNAFDEIAMDVDNVYEETQPKEAVNESEIVPKDSDDALKIEEVLKNKTINADAIAKDMGIKTSPVESESNSLDEELVYSDAEAPQQKVASNESEIVPKDSDDVLKTEEVPEDKTINTDTIAKIDMGIKTSPVESETNSLDEELVYSDAEASDIEDKDLMDEIDAEITAEINKDKLESAETVQTTSEISAIQKESESKTTAKEASDMDVDVNSTKSSNLAKDLNGTCSSVTDLEISTYDINNEHELDRPDVMIDIPTQEFIDYFDDTDDATNKLHQSQMKIMDKPDIDTTTKHDTQKNTEPQAIEEEINLKKDLSDAVDKANAAFDNILSGKVEIAVETNKAAGDTVQAESMEVDTLVSKEIEKLDIIDNSELNSSVETNKLDQENVSTLEDTESHADVILEATTELEAVISAPELSKLANEPKTVESDNLKLKVLENTLATLLADETQPSMSDKVVESTDISKLKENTASDSPLNDAQLFSPSKEDKDESSDILKLKEDTTSTVHVNEAQPSTSKVVEESSDNSKHKETETHEAQPSKSKEVKDSSKLKEVETGEAQPPTSKDVTESSDSSKLKEVETDEAQPSTSEEVKESSDNSKLKETDIDKAQPSTSKEVEESSDSSKLKDVEHELSTSNHSELSDEDQEATDSLGLLAESSRVMDDEDEQEQEAEPDDDDDDDDFEDDESNQMTAEHSEDSNAQHSEADALRETMDVDESNEAQESHDSHDLDDAVDDHEDEKSNDEKEESNDEKVESNDEKDESNDDKDDSNDEGVDLHIQIADVVSQTVEAVAKPGGSVEATEDTETAIEAILEDKKEESADVPAVAVTVEDKDAVKQTDSDSDSAACRLRQLLLKDKNSSADISEAEKKSPSKTEKLEISTPKNEINIVELEESSSEDVLTDVQIVKRSEPASPEEVTSLIDPAELESTPVDTAVMKPAKKLVRLNTDEVSIKTAPAASLAIPEVKAKTADPKASIDFGLEIYSLDSDDEETEVRSKRKSKLTALELDNARQTVKCINTHCASDGSVPLVPASMAAAVYYAATQHRGGGLCLNCANRFEERSEKLIKEGKDLTPFLSMDMCLIREEFVEISDSDSEDEPEVGKDDQILGDKAAKFLAENLANGFNVVWEKFNIEERLLAAQAEINVEVGLLEEECKEIDAMLNQCQKETDKLRNDLYTRFADDRRELPSITIYDTPTNQWSGLEEGVQTLPPVPEVREQRARPGKRRAAPAPEPAAKRAAIPLGYAPLDDPKPAELKPESSAEVPAPNDDDNADISVVKLSVEAAPAGLPPPGVATRAPLRPNMLVFAMRNTFGAWHKVRIVEVQPKLNGQFTTCRVRFEQPKTMTKLLPARCLAYEHPPDVRLTIGTRVVALFKDHRASGSGDKKEEGEKKEAYYSGIVAEIPNPVNSFRYLIFFDDGYAQYVQHSVTRLVCECAPRVWDEVHPFSRQFVRDYLRAYPERPMVRLHAGQSIKTEWDGKWWVSKVLQVDASLVLVYFEGKKDNKTEWIYRGSTRLAPLYLELQAAERTRARPLPRAQAARRFNMPYVEYTRSDETPEKVAPPQPTAMPSPQQTQAQIEQEIRRQRAVAKKSTAVAAATATAPAPVPAPAVRDNVTSRVVFYTPKNAIKPHKMVSHTCGPRCKRTDVLALKDLRTYNPLTKPLLSGWERQQVKYRIPAVKAVMYRAPCGRRIRDYRELHRYLQAIDSDMGVDLFDFNPATHCLAEFLLNKCLISKKDLSHGKENVPVPCVNYYDSSLPEFCSYNTERTPTAGVPLNLDPEFLCGCDCTDDCADKSKCACWKMTLEGARTIGLDTSEVGYVYKRLPEPLPSGIYECNVRCKCKQTCLNRVAQHPLQLKLQVFKTANRGWGIRALNDVPKGAFLCVYAGNLLTDATANLDGLNEGDEYLAELDYIEVVEQMKEGFEEDIPEDAKKLDEEESDSSSMTSSDEEQKQDGDDDFQPFMPTGHYTPSEYSKRLRKREKSKKAKEKEEIEKKEKEDKQREKDGEECITISDDEELREPAHFSVQTGMKGNKFISKYKSVRTLFGKDEACYIMDAKVQGNIGRYLNHSCTPNVFVQNVFVDSHDPRFPWVAFFALSQIRAGTELTWNYNYDVGSVPGKVLYCYCNAPNCRGRLL